MGRTPCCEKMGLKKGQWTPEEDELLVKFIKKNGHGSWRTLPKLAGLLRCGKSCRLRWTNYLRPDIKRGPFSPEEEQLVIQIHRMLGNRWAAIASKLPGRTDNEIKNLWNTHLKKRLLCMGLNPQTHEPFTTSGGPGSGSIPTLPSSPTTRHMAQWESARLDAEERLSRESLLFNPQAQGKTESDYFLRLWNSEVGDSFRNVNKEENFNSCESPVSQASSSTKCGSASAMTTENCPREELKSSNGGSDSSSSNEMDDLSDTSLQLLLDFPINNDMSFLEAVENYGTGSEMGGQSSLICPL